MMLSSDNIDKLSQYIADGILVRHNMARKPPSFDRKWFIDAVKDELSNWVRSDKPVGTFTIDLMEEGCEYNYLVGSEWSFDNDEDLLSLYHVNRVHRQQHFVAITKFIRVAYRQYIPNGRLSVDLDKFLEMISSGSIVRFENPQIRAVGMPDDEDGDLTVTTEFLNDRPPQPSPMKALNLVSTPLDVP